MTNTEIVRAFYDGVEGGHLERALELLAPDCAHAAP